MTSLEEEAHVGHNKREAIYTSLSLELDQRGNPVLHRHKVDLGSLREKLEEHFPEFDHQQELLNTCRWVDEVLNEAQQTIEREFGIDEGLYIQERAMPSGSGRPEEECGDDQDVPEGE